MSAIVESAHAKINLALAVAPPRSGDGLHPICSWFAPISLADELRVERLQPGVPSRHATRWASDAPRQTPIDWPIEKDLAVRAHRALEHEAGRELPVSLELIKRIPVGGGLGGGSSDAAAILRALLRLFKLSIPSDRIRDIALSLGSDVPYFLIDPLTPAIVEGVGESIAPTPPASAAVILILPPFGCATGAVYRAFDAESSKEFRAEAVRRMARAGVIDSAQLFNDLTRPAESVEPRLADLRRRAAEITGMPVHLTGSGSTMFIVPEHSTDRRIESLRNQLRDCSVVPVTTGGATTGFAAAASAHPERSRDRP